MRHYSLCLIFILVFSAPAFAEKTSELTEKILYEKNTLYQYLVVADDLEKKERYIYNSKRDYMQGGIPIEDPDKLIFPYYRMSFISLAFSERSPDDVLFVGLGAGAMPRWFNRHYPEVRTDVVEIDPEILKVAREYLHFEETDNMKVYISDGRRFIKRAKTRYDMIFLDAYQTDFIPFHMTTVEFLREVKKTLDENGIVVSNIVSEKKNKYFHSMIKTYREVFPRLYIFKGGGSGNHVFIATTGKRRIGPEELRERAKMMHGFDIDMLRLS
ncbi:MAG: fused MFS/spermidine synthase, partial [Nitrospirota bacterium]